SPCWETLRGALPRASGPTSPRSRRSVPESLSGLGHCRGDSMFVHDRELKVTRARIAHCAVLLAQLRVAPPPRELPSMASGYRAEIEKMQREALEYLTRHVSQPPPAQVAEATAALDRAGMK